MGYKPRNYAERKFKDAFSEVIKNGIEDFYIPTMDPSFFDKAKTKIHYMAGENLL